jgi:hypothetical protein
MTGRVQSLRSNVAGNRPTGRQPGELYVNWPDSQLGVINSTGGAQDLIAITFYTTSASYAVGQYVVQGGLLYRCVVANAPGAFNPAQWAQIGGSVGVGDTAPTTPQPGTLWWDSVGGQLYVWFVDANSSQWVIANNAAGLLASGYLALSGGTMTGPITLPGNPTAPLQTVPKQYVDALPIAMNDNRIINGDMRIDQRNAGATGVASGYAVDRWILNLTQAGKMVCGNRAYFGYTAPPGFPYMLGAVTTAAYTPLATDYFFVGQFLEADAISDFQWGSANAQPVTLSFWASISVPGTYSGAVGNYTGTRSYPFSFSLPTAGVWTKIVITIPGDTIGTWVQSGSAGALTLVFDLGSGVNFRSPVNAWAAGNRIGATGAISVVSTLNAYLMVTGVKLEIGSVATLFNRQSLAKSLADCQRYYQILQSTLVTGYQTAGGQVYTGGVFQTAMRAIPTVAFSGITYTNAGNLIPGSVSPFNFYNALSIIATGQGYALHNVAFSAEI